MIIAKQELQEQDRVVITRVLHEMYQRLHGALDFWTLMWTAEIPNRREFLLENSEKLRTLIGKLTFVQEAEPLVRSLAERAGQFQVEFLILERHSLLSPTEIQSHVHSLRQQFLRMKSEILELLHCMQLPPPSPVKEEYYRDILDSLEGMFIQANNAVVAHTS